MQELHHYMGDHFEWLNPPYEYDYENWPIDIINGTDKLRKWVEAKGTMEELDAMEDYSEYQSNLESIQLY